MCMFCRSLFVVLYFFFSFDHWVVCSSSIYGFWLPLLLSSNYSCKDGCHGRDYIIIGHTVTCGMALSSLVAWLYPPCGMALSSLVAWLYPPLFLLVFCVRVTYRKPVCRVRNVNLSANHRHSHGNKLWSYLCPSFRFKAEFMQKFIKSKSYGKIKPILLICIRPPYWIKMDVIVVLSNERLK